MFNTLFNLLTQDDQVRCFEHGAPRLTVVGVFVVEAMVPDTLYRLRNHRYVDAEAIAVGEVRLDVGRFDPVTRVLDESHVRLSKAGLDVSPIVTLLCLAERDGPDGAHRRPAATRTLGTRTAKPIERAQAAIEQPFGHREGLDTLAARLDELNTSWNTELTDDVTPSISDGPADGPAIAAPPAGQADTGLSLKRRDGFRRSPSPVASVRYESRTRGTARA